MSDKKAKPIILPERDFSRSPLKKEHPPNRIRSLRLALGWTQKDVATLIGCSPSKINMTEIRERGLSDQFAITIAKAFKVSLDYLLCLTDDPLRPAEAEIISNEVNEEAIKKHWEQVGFPEKE
jgi:transcriptional regulator with XRE-family HTH domain